MSDTLIITVDDAQAQRWFGELIQRGRDMSGLMRDIGEVLTESTQRRFATGTGPDGVPWVPLRDGSGRTPLLDTGRMRDDISPESGADWVEIRAGAKQARWHQEGTAPYVILAKGKKSLAFNGGGGPVFARKVNHPGLPARPFIGLSAGDIDVIDRLARAYLDPAD